MKYSTPEKKKVFFNPYKITKNMSGKYLEPEIKKS